MKNQSLPGRNVLSLCCDMVGESYLLLTVGANDLSCSICISQYCCPCTLPCGHTFCKLCIDRYWGESGRYICPVCQTKYLTKPQLNKNTELADLLEKLQVLNNQTNQNCQSCAGPGVLKLCLPCMAPICKDHLLLHNENNEHQRHLLVNLLTADRPWLCRHHKNVLHSFCLNHCIPLCQDCVVQHGECNAVQLYQRYKANREEIEATINEVIRNITSKEEAIISEKNMYRESQILVCDIKDNLTQDFREMRDYLERQERAAFWRVKQEQDTVLQKMKERTDAIRVEIDQLGETKVRLEEKLKNDWLGVLKNSGCNSIMYPPPSSGKMDNLFDDNRIVDTTLAVSKMKESLLCHPLLEQVPCPPKQVMEEMTELPSNTSAFVQHVESSPPAKPAKICQQWAHRVSFDPQTVNQRLSLSSDLRTVTVIGNINCYPKDDRRFDSSQVLCCEGFSTECHYWEINTEHCNGWSIGVASKEIARGDRLGRNDLSWCVEWTKDRLLTWHNNEKIPIRLAKPDLVGVLVDCRERLLSFYSVTKDVETLLHSYRLYSDVQLFPAVWLYGLTAGNSLSINEIK